MHPPHAAEIASISDLIHRRAAPIPRVLDSVSDSVLRVPNPASRRISASIRSGEEASMMEYTRASDCGGELCPNAGTESEAVANSAKIVDLMGLERME